MLVETGTFTERPGFVLVNEPAAKPESAMYRTAYGHGNSNAVRSTGPSRPSTQLDRCYSNESSASNCSSSRVPPNRQGSFNRTFEAPLVIEAGTLTERATRPGVMAVQEPVVRHDAAMYRSAHGNSTTDAVRSSGPSRPVYQCPAPTSQDNANRQGSFEHPPSEIDPRTAGKASQLMAPQSSFYRAAMEGTRQAIGQTGVHMSLEHSNSPTEAQAAIPTQMSSFYQAALLAHKAGERNSPPSMPQATLPETRVYEQVQHPLTSANVSHGASALNPQPSDTAAGNVDSPSGQVQAGATIGMENLSSFYRDALHAAGHQVDRSSFQRPDDRLVDPDDVSNHHRTTAISFYQEAQMEAENRHNL